MTKRRPCQTLVSNRETPSLPCSVEAEDPIVYVYDSSLLALSHRAAEKKFAFTLMYNVGEGD
jgi:hypothetical protein